MFSPWVSFVSCSIVTDKIIKTVHYSRNVFEIIAVLNHDG